MPPPGGLAATAAPRWNHEQRQGSQAEACPETVEAAIRMARVILADTGAVVSQSKLSRLARSYFATRGDDQSLENWIYADPTGKTAARNVDKARRAA